MLDNYPDVLSFRQVMEITHVGRNLLLRLLNHLLRRNFFRVQDGDHLRQQNAAENCIQIFLLATLGWLGQDGHFQTIGCVF